MPNDILSALAEPHIVFTAALAIAFAHVLLAEVENG